MEANWYFERNGTGFGPLTREQLLVCAQRGEVRPEDLVWNDAEARPVPLQVATALVAMPVAVEVLEYERAGGELYLSEHAFEYFAEIRGWARFIGVMCFVPGVLLLGCCAARSFPGNDPMLFLMIGLVASIPGIFLNRFASRLGPLARRRQSADLDAALASLKSAFKSVGVIAILMICAIGFFTLVIRLP